MKCFQAAIANPVIVIKRWNEGWSECLKIRRFHRSPFYIKIAFNKEVRQK